MPTIRNALLTIIAALAVAVALQSQAGSQVLNTNCTLIAVQWGESCVIVATAPPLPPEGMYNSCEIDTALTTDCELRDSAMSADGYTKQINYESIQAYLTNAQSSNSLQAWFAYDAALSPAMAQFMSVKLAVTDASGVLTGTSLYTQDTNIGIGCSAASGYTATQNASILACIANVCNASVGCAGFYLADEPGCPTTSAGFCDASLGLTAQYYQNVQILHDYLTTVTTKELLIIQTPSGVPPGCSNNWNSVTCGQSQINSLFSCASNPICTGWSSPYTNNWLTPYMQSLGFDYYPFCTNSPPQTGTQCVNQTADDPQYIAQSVAVTYAANEPGANMSFTGQAFSWFQEGGAGCTASISTCPFPTTAQMQDERDHALYWARFAGYPLHYIFWYYWPDVTCLTTYTGCNSATNRSIVKAAAFAPYPTSAPTP